MTDRSGREPDPAGPGDASAGAPGADGPDTDERQLAVDALCEAFARDEIGVDEFERRIERAHAATSRGELQALLRGLSVARPPAAAGPGEGEGAAVAGSAVSPWGDAMPAPPPPEGIEENSFAVGLLGGTTRSGGWIPARTTFAVGALGGVTLDFREAHLGPGVTQVRAFALCGGVDILVPPWVRVECSGIGILGGFEENRDLPSPTDPGAPILRIAGLACMGGVSVTVRLPGESSGDARRRRKAARRNLRERRREDPRLGRGE